MGAQILGGQDGSKKLPPNLNEQPPDAPGGITGFLEFLGDDAHEVKAEQVDEMLHNEPKILQAAEQVEKAYKCGRDMVVFTTLRLLFVDVQGWSGKKVQYLSFPLHFCKGFSVQSPGAITLFMHGAKASVFADCPGNSKI